MSPTPTRLRSTFDPSRDTVSIELVAGTRLAVGWRLALTSIVQLTPTQDARLVRRLASYHELEPVDDVQLAPGDAWLLDGLTVGHVPAHANDGPVSAFMIRADGSTEVVDVAPMTRVLAAPVAGTPRSNPVSRSGDPGDVRPPLVPFPRGVALTDPTPTLARSASLACSGAAEEVAIAWRAIADLAERVCGTRLLTDAGGDVTVTAVRSVGFAPEAYRLDIDDAVVSIAAGDPAGFRHAFVTIAQWLAAGLCRRASVDDVPTYGWRGLHVDLARQWFEPDVVARLVDVAAWRKMSRLHLHLTDDEAWRLPVPEHPELAVVGARRGHGLPLPPMLGGGADPCGRAYRPEEIARWVTRADELGVVLVPEIDLPAHVHAALTALPELRDPDDDTGAVSVQFFTDNVLVPGLPSTDAFVEQAIRAVVSLFPDSPWIHIGGDEVPAGAWTGSPAVQRFRAQHDLPAAPAAVEATFHRQLVQLVRTRHGRSVGAWQEAAEAGGVRPGDGYVVGWRSVDVNRRLAAAGHDVVVSPGRHYYFDMAVDDEWSTPGASWAGSTSLEDVCAFDPAEGWSDDERSHLLGVQACIWTEHVRDEGTLLDRLFPRLDAVAERGWTGAIVGGAASLATRSAAVRAPQR